MGRKNGVRGTTRACLSNTQSGCCLFAFLEIVAPCTAMPQTRLDRWEKDYLPFRFGVFALDRISQCFLPLHPPPHMDSLSTPSRSSSFTPSPSVSLAVPYGSTVCLSLLSSSSPEKSPAAISVGTEGGRGGGGVGKNMDRSERKHFFGLWSRDSTKFFCQETLTENFLRVPHCRKSSNASAPCSRYIHSLQF